MRLTVVADNATEEEGLKRGLVPVPMHEGYFGFMGARAIMAGCSLGVFSSLNDEPADSATLARRLGLAEDGTQGLLGVLETMEYVELDDHGRYGLTAKTKKWLLPESPASIGVYIGGFNYFGWEAWSLLGEGLRSGKPTLDRHDPPADDPYWDTYIRSVYELARSKNAGVAQTIDLTEPKTMLDVAGGHGAYSAALCERYPGLHSTIVDLAGSVRVGKAIARENGYEDKITWKVGNALNTELGTDYDLVLISAFIHYLTPEQCLELLERVHAALRPGGTLAVSDYAFDRNLTQNQSDALVALDYIVSTGHRPYYISEIVEYAKQAGFSDVHQHPEVTWRMLVLGIA